jgi:hypothetical protein
VKRTGLDAVTAADATILKMHHDPVRSPFESPCGAGRNARRVIAVKTRRRYGPLIAVRKAALDMALHPPKLYPRGGIIFQLTAHLARVTANALLPIKKDQTFVHSDS